MTTLKHENSRDLKVCSKRFLNSFQLEAIANENGYFLNKKIKDAFWLNVRNDEPMFDNS